MIGGPGIGDIRSRLVRLIPSDLDDELEAISALLSYRLTSASGDQARVEWLDIVEGTHK